MKFYKNPLCTPLELLKLDIKSDGVVVVVEALSSKWAEKRYFLRYEAPEIYKEDGSEILGYKEYWLELVNYIIEDLIWLLNLPFYRFWSNIVYNTSIIDTLVSFLQEVQPFYALETFPAIPEMLEALEKLRYNVLMVFVRLVMNKESLTEYMQRAYLGNLLYNNYIFTIPIIFDLCQLYGRENDKLTEKILCNIFSMQPLYNDDLEKSVPCLIRALKNVEQKFEDCPIDTTEAMALSEKRCVAEITLNTLESLILYVLDISSTLTILLKRYPPVIDIFCKEDFMSKILSVYGNTIPQMYRTLNKLAYNDECMPKYIELKHRLDVTRVEMLDLYRTIVYEPISNIQKKLDEITRDEIKNYIDQYLYSLINAISEKEFIMDYHKFYPIDDDLKVVSEIYSDVDTINSEYILSALYASIGDTKMPTNISSKHISAGPSGAKNNEQNEYNDMNHINKEAIVSNSDKLMSCISKVKEILCGYNEDFIQICLKHYDYNVESVINAVLENTLPPNLRRLDETLSFAPPNSMEPPVAVDSDINVQRLNIFHNNEFDVLALPRIYRGKRQEKYKDANEMLNDKSEIDKSIYKKYSIIDEVDDYDDEYDDTYDSHNIRNSTPDSTEIDSRPFTTPRIFCTNDKYDVNSEDEIEIEDEKSIQSIDHFVQNPVNLRTEVEQREQSTRGKHSKNIVGKSGGQEQKKDVSTKGHKKNIHKSSHVQSNHNRRIASQMKRKQGMIPS